MKFQIMLKILMIILNKRKVTAAQLARNFEISQRSVYRYIIELELSGVPLVIERGRYGGISMSDTFRLPSGYFTQAEYTATCNALRAMIEQLGDSNLLSALEKLERQQKRDERDNSVCGNILVDGGTWGDMGKFGDKMRVCEEAVNDCKQLQIDYISRNGEHSIRKIDPHVLVFKQNVWYVYAFCHTKQNFRTFKIGRIKQAFFTGSIFKKEKITRDEIDLNFISWGSEKIEINLEIEKNYLSICEEWLGVDNIEVRGDKLIATTTVPNDDSLVLRILGYGGAVKVISPLDLKEKVKAAALKIAQS